MLRDNVIAAWNVRDRLIARRFEQAIGYPPPAVGRQEHAGHHHVMLQQFADRTFDVCEALQQGEHLHALNLACAVPGAFELAAVVGSAFLPDTWEDGTPVEANPW